MIQKPPLGSRIIPGHPLANGLVGAWIMNEGGGNTVFDLSGNGNNGTITGADWIGDKLQFIAANSDRLNVTGITSTGSQTFIFNGLDVGTTESYLFDSNASRLLIYASSGTIKYYDGSGFTILVAASYPSGEFNLALVFNSANNNAYGYVDGILDTSDIGNYNAVSIGGAAHFFAKRDGLGNYCDATIKSILYYNRALTAEEIASLHADPYIMIREKRVAAVPMIPVPSTGMWVTNLGGS